MTLSRPPLFRSFSEYMRCDTTQILSRPGLLGSPRAGDGFFRFSIGLSWLPSVSLAGLAFAMERRPNSLGGLHPARVYMPAMICGGLLPRLTRCGRSPRRSLTCGSDAGTRAAGGIADDRDSTILFEAPAPWCSSRVIERSRSVGSGNAIVAC